MFGRNCQGTADCVKASLELIQLECLIIAAGLWLFVLIAVVILVVYLCCVTPPKKPVKKVPQVWKPIQPVVEVPVTAPQQPASSKSGEGKKSTAKSDSEQREVIPPVVSLPPDAGGEDQPEINAPAEVLNNEQPDINAPAEVPNNEQPEINAPAEVPNDEQPEINAPAEVPNDEQPQQVPQQPGDSQHTGQKEWGVSVLLPPPTK